MKIDTVTLPVGDVAALVQLAWELTRHISQTDQSATGSIYGIEFAHKTIARVAVQMPARLVDEEAVFSKSQFPIKT